MCNISKYSECGGNVFTFFITCPKKWQNICSLTYSSRSAWGVLMTFLRSWWHHVLCSLHCQDYLQKISSQNIKLKYKVFHVWQKVIGNINVITSEITFHTINYYPVVCCRIRRCTDRGRINWCLSS